MPMQRGDIYFVNLNPEPSPIVGGGSPTTSEDAENCMTLTPNVSP